MEPQIIALDERLSDDPEWRAAVARLDQTLLLTSLDSVKLLTRFFGHDEGQPDSMLELAWRSLKPQILYFLREIDSSGISRILGEVAPALLSDFSYSNSEEFRRYEEALLSDLEIPDTAWDRFWARVDRNKEELLYEMRLQTPYSAYRHLSSRVTENFLEGPGPYIHLSPFRWWKPVVAGLGAAVGIIDGIAVAPTGGIAITSYVASIAAAVATSMEK